MTDHPGIQVFELLASTVSQNIQVAKAVRPTFHIRAAWVVGFLRFIPNAPYAFLKQSVALCPPKPSELDNATWISISRFSLGT